MKPRRRVNRELETFLEGLRKEYRSRSFCVVTWQPRVEYFHEREDALAALARTPVKHRGALVNLKTGETWAHKSIYRTAIAIVRNRKVAPQRFRRVGNIGRISEHKKRGPQ